MNSRTSGVARVVCVLALMSIAWVEAAFAQESIYSIKGVLGTASEIALNKLSEPGAFSSDDTIRIMLLGRTPVLGDVPRTDQKRGSGTDFDSSLNRAAEAVVAQAKPAFRAAIDRLTRRDAGRMTAGGNTAATSYLKKVAGDEILASLVPLTRDALAKYGVMRQAAALASTGMSPDRLTTYVAQRTYDAIFFYMGQEERQSRLRPAEAFSPTPKGPRF